MRDTHRLLLALSGLIVMAEFPSRSFGADVNPPRISVRGVGKVKATPNVADIQFGVRTHAETAANALAANSEAMNKLHAILKQRGIAAKDIQTTQIQVTPQYSEPNPANPPPVAQCGGGPGQNEFVPRLVGYQVDDKIHVTLHDVAKLGALLDAMVQGGANEVGWISFRVEEATQLLDQARRRAVADAKRKASILAEEAGVILGPPRTIDEEDGPFEFAPQGMARMAAPAPMAPTPIAPGEQELSVNVRVEYELRTK